MAEQMITPVVLPTGLDGVTLAWDPWEIAPIMSHVPYDCEHCGSQAEPAMTMATSAERRGRWMAIRCRRCQATRVTTWQSNPQPFGSRVEVWSAPPQPYAAENGADQ